MARLIRDWSIDNYREAGFHIAGIGCDEHDCQFNRSFPNFRAE